MIIRIHKTALEILTDARALIAQGWTRGRFSRRRSTKNGPKTCYCALGAFNAACRTYGSDMVPDGHIETLRAKRALDDAVRRDMRGRMAADPTNRIPLYAIGPTNPDVVYANDTVARSKRDVLAWYDEAIEAVKAATP